MATTIRSAGVRLALFALIALAAVFSGATPLDASPVGTMRVSTDSSGNEVTSASFGAGISADGVYATFVSGDANLVPGDTNGDGDVFVKDRLTGSTVRVSLPDPATGNPEGNGGALSPTAISANGRFVAFYATSTNLVLGGDANGTGYDAFVRDRDLDGNGTFDEAGVGNTKTVLVSISSAGTQGDFPSVVQDITPDGRFVTMFSGADNLVSGDTNGANDIFVHDRDADNNGVFDETGAGERATVRVSIASDGTEGDSGGDHSGSISPDGRLIAFQSVSTNLVAGDTNDQEDIFVHDRDTDTDGVFDETGEISTVLVSVATDGTAGDDYALNGRMSTDGRFVTWDSASSNMGTGDNAGSDVFVRDRDLDDDGIFDESGAVATRLGSLNSSGTPGNGSSGAPSMSADGRYIAYASAATNLVTGDTNAAGDIFVLDRDTDRNGVYDEPGSMETTRVSVGPADLQADLASSFPNITPGGRLVAFVSFATNLVAGDTNGSVDAFVHDRLDFTGTWTVVIAGSTAAPGLGPVYRCTATLTQTVTIVNGSFDCDIPLGQGGVLGSTVGPTVVLLVDFLDAGPTTLTLTGTASLDLYEGRSDDGVLPVDGFFIMARGEPEGEVTERMSTDSAGGEGNGDSAKTRISADGRYVAFISYTGNLVPGDTNANPDVFVKDRRTGGVTRVNIPDPSTGNTEAAGFSDTPNSFPGISSDGRYVSFISASANLVLGDTNGVADAFVHDRDADGNGIFDEAGLTTTVRVSVDSAGSQATSGADISSVSRDGRFVAFESSDLSLVPGDTNNGVDIFVRDRDADTDGIFDETGVGEAATIRVSVATDGSEGDSSSSEAEIAGNGRFISFTSGATNLAAGDTNGDPDAFVHDRDADADLIYDEPGFISTVRVSVTDAGGQGNNPSGRPQVTPDGRVVVFVSGATNLDPPSPTGGVFVHDRDVDGDSLFDEPGFISTRQANKSADGSHSSGFGLLDASISDNGRFVVYHSLADDIVPGDTNSDYDIFVLDRDSDRDSLFDEAGAFRVYRESVTTDGQEATSTGSTGVFPDITPDGRHIVFSSTAPDLIIGDTNGFEDIFVRDRKDVTGTWNTDSVRIVPIPGANSCTNHLSQLHREWIGVSTCGLGVGVGTMRASHALDGSMEGSGSYASGYANTFEGTGSVDTSSGTYSDVFNQSGTFTASRQLANLSALYLITNNPTVSAGSSFIPIDQIPLDSIIGLRNALPSSPLGSIPLGSIPLGSIPLGSIPLGSIELNGLPLGSIHLSEVPINRTGGWGAVLQGTNLENQPLTAITLKDVLDLVSPPPAIQSLTLEDVDLSDTSLRSVGVGALALGGLPLGSIPVGDVPELTGYSSWCDFLLATVSFNCAANGLTDGTPIPPTAALTALDLSIRGVPLGSIPLGSIPLGSINPNAAPLGSIPLGSIPLGSIPLGSIPLGSIPLGSINIAGAPLGSIPLGSIDIPGPTDDPCANLASYGVQYGCASLNIDGSDSLQDLIQAILEITTDIESSPLGSIPLGSIPLGSIPLGSIPLGSIPLGSIPLGSIPLGSIQIEGNPLGSILLDDMFTVSGDGCDYLADYPDYTCPDLGLNPLTATLQDAFDEIRAGGDAISASPLGSITMATLPLGSIDLDAVPLGSIPLGSIPLGSIMISSVDVFATPLGSIPLGSIPLGSIAIPNNYGDWCAFLASFDNPIYLCPALLIDPATDSLGDLYTAIDNATTDPLSSTPLGSIPLGSIPLGSIPLGSIPLGSIPLGSISVRGTPLGSIPLGSIDLDASPLGSIPLGSIPLGSIPLGSIPLGSIPLGSIPLGSIPLGSIEVASSPLGSIPLGSIDPPGTTYSSMCPWLLTFHSDFHCTTLGVSDLSTLLDLYNALVATEVPLSATPLGSITWEALEAYLTPADYDGIPLSAIPLGSIPLGSIMLGSPLGSIDVTASPLGSIPLGSIDPPGPTTDLCTYFLDFAPQYQCANLTLDSDPTLAELYAEILAIPSTIEASPLGSIPLGSIPLGSIPLGSIHPNPSPLGSIPLGSITNANDIVDCGIMDCIDDPTSQTLGQAEDAGAIRPGVTLSDIEDYVGGYSVGDLGGYQDKSLEGLIAGLSGVVAPEDIQYYLGFAYGNQNMGDGYPHVKYGTMTYGDILRGLLDRADYPWEDLQFDQIGANRFAYTGDEIVYVIGYQNTGGSLADDVVLSVTLPDGFYYVIGQGGLEGTQVGNVVTFPPFDVAAGSGLNISFLVRPGLRLGTFRSSAFASDEEGGTLTLNNTAPVAVTEHFEPANDTAASAPVIDDDNLIVSHISSAADKDFYRIPVPADGSRVAVFLSHLEEDEDLVLYRPTTALNNASAVPSRSIGLGTIPIEDDGLSLNGAGLTLSPEGLQDISIEGLTLASAGIKSAGESEGAQIVKGAETGYYTIQVSGYNGAFSSLPYVLRVRIIPEPTATVCPARTFPFSGSAGSLPGSIPTGTNTFILTNQDRWGDYWTPGTASILTSFLNAPVFKDRTDVKGVVIPVEGDPGVAAAYAAWDAAPCDPAKANGVVRAITALIQNLSTTYNVDPQYIVIAGPDEIIPFGRVADVTRTSNEARHSREVEYATGSQGAISGSLGSRTILTDDPYGDKDPIPWLGRQLFVPERAVGRLVETPTDIAFALSQFVDPDVDGKLDPRTAEGRPLDPRRSFTTGYDFLDDGATAVDTALAGFLGAPYAEDLIDPMGPPDPLDPWTAQDVIDVLNPITGYPPELISVNGHYNQYQSLPSDQLAEIPPIPDSDLFDTGDVDAFPPDSLQGRILFSMGCHFGLNIPDVLVASPTSEQAKRINDWAQALSEQDAVMIGNTGFGYGSDRAGATSERLMLMLSRRLNGSMTVGQALWNAKQEYFSTLGVYGVYDEKSLQEATLYGLPMYQVGDIVDPPDPPAPLPTQTEPIANLRSLSIHTEPDVTAVTSPDGDYYEVTGDDGAPFVEPELPQVTHYRPIQPRMDFDVTQPDGIAHGALITNLAEAAPVTSFDAVFARPIIDNSEEEPEVEYEGVFFPTVIQNLSTYNDLNGRRQNLVLMPGQYSEDQFGNGVQRLFSEMDATVYYSDDTNFIPPEVHRAEGAVIGSTVGFTVDTSDDSPATVVRVLVLYRDLTGVWQSVDLVRTGLTNIWTGGGGVTGTEVEFIVQAVDHAGNVAVSSNKGDYFEATLPVAASEITPYVSGTLGGEGWYDTNVDYWFTASGGATVETSLDDGPYAEQPGTLSLTTDGIHTIDYRLADDPDTGTLIIAIDKTGPQVIADHQPDANAAGWNNEDFTIEWICVDAGSGVAPGTCPGPNSFTVDGEYGVIPDPEDRAGNTGGGLFWAKLDKTIPTISATPQDADLDGWLTGLLLTLSDPGGSGPKEILYSIDFGIPQMYPGGSYIVGPFMSSFVEVDFGGLDIADNPSLGDFYFSTTANDNCPSIPNPGQENSDGDALGDLCDLCPIYATSWIVPPGDSDCDAFTNTEEATIGTDAGDPCPDNTSDDAWPADFDKNKVVNILDIVQLTPPVFGTSGTPGSHPSIFPRKDISPNGTINILDVVRVTPPVFGAACT